MAILLIHVVLDSIVVSIPACHAGDRGSIPRRGGNVIFCIDIIDIKMERVKATCIGRESNPGRPRGRRAFYH